MKAVIRTNNESETILLGERIGALLRPGDIIALTGDLGAGKTTITKGIAKGAGVSSEVFSPTFTLIHEHRGETPLYHIDLYRIESEDAIPDLGLEEYLYSSGITIIEWSERMGALLPETALQIRMVMITDTERDIELTASSPRWDETIDMLQQTGLSGRELGQNGSLSSGGRGLG